MRHLVRIERRTTTQDQAGQQHDEWHYVTQQRAAIERMPGAEIWASSQRSGRVPTVFTLRYVSGITPAMRLILLSDGDKVFNIQSAIDEGGRHEKLTITAEELVDE